MKKYALAPEEILVVDDMKPAWEIAQKVGVPIAFAQWGKADCPEICNEMRRLCRYSFDTPKEMEDFLF